MKLFLVVLCAAFVAAEPEAEADPLLVRPYSTGLYSGYSGLYNPAFSTYGRSGIYNQGIYNRGFYGARSNIYNPYFKRDADAESDPESLLYRQPYTSGIYNTGLYNQGYAGLYNRPAISSYSAGTYSPYTSSIYNRGLYSSNIYNPYFKRDAEAESDPESLLYRQPYTSGIYNTGLYNQGYAGLYNRPAISSYSAGTYSPYTSSIYNQGLYSNTGLYNRFFKRDADAESDAESLLVRQPYTAGIYNTGLYNQGYAGLYNRPAVSTYSTGLYNSGLYNTGFYNQGIYNRGVFGGRFVKRDADADANLVYKHGDFHTNVQNLQKGIHHQYTGPASQVYQTAYQTPFYNQAAFSTYNRFPQYHF